MAPKKSQAALAAQRAVKVRRRLLNAAQKDPDTLLIQYDTSYEGFDEEKIEDMRDQYGVNAITKAKKETVLKKLFDAFINPFTVVLFVLASVSFVTDFMLPANNKDLTAVIIVMTMITVSGLLRLVQEFRSGKAAEKLTEMVETTVAVQRAYTDEEDEDIQESRREELPLDELVVGDVIYLAAGDMIPADVRILQAKDLFVSQSSLTGESEPVEKFSAPIKGKSRQPLELNNLAFMGSNVVSGSAAALVLAVGDDTSFGQIARQLQEKRPETSFEKGIRSVSWVLIRFMMIMVPVVLFVNGFTKGDWMEALLFGLSIAVGLTPEMLPMIVSANLAKGAVSMSQKQVIVKDLNSIQNFGAMDILCTDKTGTITQDKVILEYHLSIDGEESERVLRHAFLNSYHQTGLKNLMDLSIIQTAGEYEQVGHWKTYQKVDEIPFDFNRRRMSVVVSDQTGKTQLITKGAIEEMLAVSQYAEVGGEVVPVTDEIRENILESCRDYNADGLRILGLAQKTNPSPAGAFSVNDESGMVLMGYLAFLDPPKESAEAAIAALHDFGVDVKVLTGDNDAVTRCVCKQVGIQTDRILLGADVEGMDDRQLRNAVEDVTVFAKLSPQQKVRVVTALRENGHTVGFMGDGINDAAAMRAADVGISVDTAVDIAKESANIILMEKDLMVLEQGVIEGRKIYANIIKYIKMTASSNFGNMFSVLAASAFLPFLPMLPLQILVLNLIYDLSCITIPWDNVDMDYLKKPRAWEASSITKFMLWIGPISSIFDITTYALLFWVICPSIFGGAFATLGAAEQTGFAALFHAGWFVMSLWSQTLVIHMIRTPKIPFIQSRASWQVTGLTTLGIAVGTAFPFVPFISEALGMHRLPAEYFAYLTATILCYMLLVTLIKKLFVRRYGELL
ncbi:MAG: magnesium-translocating P-type ATPase [Oscillospiraceae bacterium]|jgi:Mg2+-importing ATPase|nr:magnesium-translocating P-type ATPase [Oscillospiraceae bacterium]